MRSQVFPRYMLSGKKAPRPPSPNRQVRPEAKETGPSNRKPIKASRPPDAQAQRGGRAGRGRAGSAPACGALRSGSRPTGRRAPRPFALPSRCAGLQEKPAPRAPAVRNPVVTIVITVFILNDNDHYYVFTFLACKVLNSGV